MTEVALDAALSMRESAATGGVAGLDATKDPRAAYLAEAQQTADALWRRYGHEVLKITERDLIPFVYL